MELTPHVEALRDRLLAGAAAAGPEGLAVVERLVPGLEAAVRVALLEALSAAAEEITAELAPGSVEVRLRGSDPDFAVVAPAGDAGPLPGGAQPVWAEGEEEGSTSRLNLRLPDTLKGRIEEAARREGLSLNTWLVRAAASALEGTAGGAGARRGTPGSQRFTGWVR